MRTPAHTHLVQIVDGVGALAPVQSHHAAKTPGAKLQRTDQRVVAGHRIISAFGDQGALDTELAMHAQQWFEQVLG